jgi:peptidoglycan/LPS O-acetylase OafA/YrhL
MQEARLSSLDAVRGIAALSVAVPHYFLFRGREDKVLEFISVVAVEVFFVLSGVVLAAQLMHCVETGSFRDVKVFYIRRWMRTLPPYVIVLLGMAILTGNAFTGDFFAYLFFVRNFERVREANDFFLVAWSLAVEEWFYFLFPVFLVLVTRRASAVVAGLAFLAVFLIAKLVTAAYFPDVFAMGRRVTLLRMDSICAGFLLSFVLMRLAANRTVLALAIVPLFAVSLGLTWWSAGAGSVMVYAYAAPVFAGCLIVLFVGAEPVFARAAIAPVAAFFASISYMVYLSHTILITVLSPRLAGIAEWIQFAIYLATLIAFCWASYAYMESRILKVRPRYQAARGGKLETVPA